MCFKTLGQDLKLKVIFPHSKYFRLTAGKPASDSLENITELMIETLYAVASQDMPTSKSATFALTLKNL